MTCWGGAASRAARAALASSKEAVRSSNCSDCRSSASLEASSSASARPRSALTAARRSSMMRRCSSAASVLPISSLLSSLRASTSANSSLFLRCSCVTASFSSRGEGSVLTRALFLISLARRPNRRVEHVSWALERAGEQQTTSEVRQLPPKASLRIIVSFESRYGMCLPLPWSSESLWMTLVRAESDLLIIFASSRVWPDAPVLPTLSDPARSTRFSLDMVLEPSMAFVCSMNMLKME
mmetsp:Transcript_20250/g.39327  ORF Transcript_20250/g.39327 Transcript_20250/m.39327 type:complete len:239 (-) Transcript_20250:809-1525(-)